MHDRFERLASSSRGRGALREIYCRILGKEGSEFGMRPGARIRLAAATGVVLLVYRGAERTDGCQWQLENFKLNCARSVPFKLVLSAEFEQPGNCPGHEELIRKAWGGIRFSRLLVPPTLFAKDQQTEKPSSKDSPQNC